MSPFIEAEGGPDIRLPYIMIKLTPGREIEPELFDRKAREISKARFDFCRLRYFVIGGNMFLFSDREDSLIILGRLKEVMDSRFVFRAVGYVSIRNLGKPEVRRIVGDKGIDFSLYREYTTRDKSKYYTLLNLPTFLSKHFVFEGEDNKGLNVEGLLT